MFSKSQTVQPVFPSSLKEQLFPRMLSLNQIFHSRKNEKDFCTKFSIRLVFPLLSENNFWQSGSFCPPRFQEGKGGRGRISEKVGISSFKVVRIFKCEVFLGWEIFKLEVQGGGINLWVGSFEGGNFQEAGSANYLQISMLITWKIT